jgi:two-component system sensor histidine kinase HydH
VSRLSVLLEQFRSLSRRERFDFQRITPANLVGEAIELELPSYAEMGIQVDFSLAQTLPVISVDIDKMKQVILNLAKNAAEAMPAGGRISLTGFVSGDNLILEIADTGSGIANDVDVFEPFFTTKPKGTGIGLAIVRQIVRAHGGSVDYTSRPGRGTIFTVSLPIK